MKDNNRIFPPNWPKKFLLWFCKPELAEEIEGDLHEEFVIRSQKNPRLAVWIYAFQVVSFIRPFALKKWKDLTPDLNAAMIWHYSKISVRSFNKQKLISTINILSLSLGIGATILIYLFVFNEMSFDTFHKNADDIYRINRMTYDARGKAVDGIEGHPIPFSLAAKELVPEIEGITGIYEDDVYVKSSRLTTEETFYVVEPDFLKMFDFAAIHGHLSSALSGTNDIVLTSSLAAKHFGNLDVVGEAIEVYSSKGYQSFLITAVIRDPPPNSTLQFDLLLPFEYLNNTQLIERYGNSWNLSFMRNFAMLASGTEVLQVEEKLKSLAELHFTDREHLYSLHGEDSYYGYEFQSMKELHFDRELPSSLHEPGDQRSLKILSGIGLIILLLACINFAVLAIGRSSHRIPEIAMRKAIGAKRSQVVHQFLGESLLMAFLSLGIGLLLAGLFVGEFGRLANRPLNLYSLANFESISFIMALTVISGFTAGIYPAFYLSRFESVIRLSNMVRFGSKNLFSEALITLQLTMCGILVFLSLIMTDQLIFLKNRDLGFEDELLMVVQRNGASREQFFNVYSEQVRTDPNLLGMSATAPALSHGSYSSEFKYNGAEIPYNIFFVESNYLEVMGMDMAVGRFFSPDRASDSTDHIVVNEAFVKALGWDDAVGRKVEGLDNAGYEEPVIIGVVNDFNYASLEYEIGPVWMALSDKRNMEDLLVRIRPDEIQHTIRNLENTWNELAPGIPFTYSFLDEDMASLYASHERWARIVKFSAYLCLVIAYFGMFGLIALALTTRLREIGIRKILGAGIKDLGVFLSSAYAKLLLISILIAFPSGWYLAGKWLNNFAFHINLNPLFFLITFVILIAVFLLTLSFHLVRSAYINPVEALRT